MTDRPVDNAPYLSHTHAGLTIEGYSRAAVQSYWRVPELKLGFDLGAHPWDFNGTPNWFISHTHLDHIAALPVYVARRRMMKMEPPRVFVPAEAFEDVKKLLLIFQRIPKGMPFFLVEENEVIASAPTLDEAVESGRRRLRRGNRIDVLELKTGRKAATVQWEGEAPAIERFDPARTGEAA